MPEPDERFERQAAWQRSRRQLPWPEKIRLALEMREVALRLREATTVTPSPSTELSGGVSQPQ
jgi:hypothetical protein